MTSFIVSRAWPMPSSHTARSMVVTALAVATFSISSRVMSRMKPAGTRLSRTVASSSSGGASEGAAGAPSDALPRLLVRDVARDDLVHRLARVADALLAHGEIDGGHGLGRRHFLDLLAGHVAHEARGHPVEPHGGLLELGGGIGGGRRGPLRCSTSASCSRRSPR